MSEFFLLFVGNNENSTEKKVWIDKAVKNEAVKSSYASVVKGKRSSPVKQVMNNTLREQQPIKGARERMWSNHCGSAKVEKKRSFELINLQWSTPSTGHL